MTHDDKRVGDALALRGDDQQHAAVGCWPSTVERADDFLAVHGWETERQQGFFGHGGCGSRDRVDCLVSTSKAIDALDALRDTRQRIPEMPLKKTS